MTLPQSQRRPQGVGNLEAPIGSKHSLEMNVFPVYLNAGLIWDSEPENGFLTSQKL